MLLMIPAVVPLSRAVDVQTRRTLRPKDKVCCQAMTYIVSLRTLLKKLSKYNTGTNLLICIQKGL